MNILLVLFLGSGAVQAQNYEEYLGLPGDNLNLYVVMDIFRNSPTLEEFEQKINDPETMVNNLDLNMDGYVDYITVHSYSGDGVHTIVLRVAISRVEEQDVAVFFIQKLSNGEVAVQLVGDEALYGPDYIIEPSTGGTPNPGYNAGTSYSGGGGTTVVYQEVRTWPIVVYVWDPYYVPWHSTWYWGYYPPYWRPWAPHYWHYYYGYHYHWYRHHRHYYHYGRHHRNRHYHTVYVTNVRRSSVTINNNITGGRYKETYKHPESRVEGETLYRQRVVESGRFPQNAQEVNTPQRQVLQRSNPTRVQDSQKRTGQSVQEQARPVESKSLGTQKDSKREVTTSKGTTTIGSDRVKPAEKPQSVAKPATIPQSQSKKPATTARPSSSQKENKPVSKPASKPVSTPKQETSVKQKGQDNKGNIGSSSSTQSSGSQKIEGSSSRKR